MKISRTKTEYVTNGMDEDKQATISLGVNIKVVYELKYLGSVMDAAGGMGRETNYRVQYRWKKL